MENETVTTASVWTVLLPVVVGGILALLGSTIGPLAIQLLSTRHAQQKVRIARFEEMLSVIYAHDYWLERRRSERLYGPETEETQAPIHRALLLASLYFPNLLSDLKRLEVATHAYEMWMFSAKQKRLSGKISTVNDGFLAVYEPYRESFTAFHTRATDYASERGGKV